MPWTPFALPKNTFAKMVRERLENHQLLNIQFAKGQSSAHQSEKENYRFEPIHRFWALTGRCGVAVISDSPWVEMWQVETNGRIEEYAVYWTSPFKGIVLHKFTNRYPVERVKEISLHLAGSLDTISHNHLSSTIELTHAPKNVIENTKRLFAGAKLIGTPPTVEEFYHCLLKGKNFLHRAEVIHGEAITKIIAATSLSETKKAP